MNKRPCPCGSGLLSYWHTDARGIPMFRACVKCVDAKNSRYRADVLHDPDYACVEAIDED